MEEEHYTVYFTGHTDEAHRSEAWTIVYPDGRKRAVPSVIFFKCSSFTDYRNVDAPTTGILYAFASDVGEMRDMEDGSVMFIGKDAKL